MKILKFFVFLFLLSVIVSQDTEEAKIQTTENITQNKNDTNPPPEPKIEITENITQNKNDTNSSSDAKIEVIENNTQNKNETYFPPEILKEYAEYETLEELDNTKTCNYENMIDQYNENYVITKIKQKNCIPDAKTLNMVLETGWEELAQYLVKEVYLAQHIDPTSTIYTFIRNNESKMKTIKNLISDYTKFDKIPINYKFENLDNSVKLLIKLPDPTYAPEYFSIFCQKDLFKLHAIFKSRNKIIRMVDSKTLYDHMEGECQYNFNYFEHQIEVSFNKLSKLKVWDRLFK